MSSQFYEIVANTDELTREQWLEMRTSGLGGSDIAAALGLSKWKTPFGLYMDKAGQGAEVEESESMYFGTLLEDVVAQEFSKRTALQVERFPYLMRSKKYPFMLANIDRLLTGMDAGLECKTANAAAEKEWADDMVPEAYMLQCYHYMIVTGLRTWYIACLIGGQKFLWRKLTWDDEVANSIIMAEEAFWKMVELQTPPSAMGGDVDLLQLLYKGTNTDEIILPDYAYQTALEYNAASAREKIAKEEKDAHKAKLIELIGCHTKARVGDIKISYPVVNTDRLDTDRLKKLEPELYRQYIKTTESRRFSLK